MNQQEFFDKTVAEMRRREYKKAEGCPAGEKRIRCLYRNEQGLGCAIGMHIPEELYRPEMDAEPMGPGSLLASYPELGPVFEGLSARFLVSAQGMLHDWPDGPESMEKAFAEFAQHYGLTYTPPEGYEP